MSKKRKIILWVIVIILLFTGGALIYAANITKTAKKVVENSHQRLEQPSELRKKVVDPRIDNISVLFLGVDADEDENINNARTDAIIFTTFNKKEKSIHLVSIPRDSRVEIVGRDEMDKINHAHAFGGIDMTAQTVEKLLGVPVDYYVRLNFNAFVEIVDILGGIEIDVPFDIVEQDSQRRRNQIHLEKGLQLLDGEQALAYARTRKYDSDIERGKRQLEVMEAMIKKGLTLRNVTKYNDVLLELEDNMTTNMSFDDLVAFHDYAYRGVENEIVTHSLDGTPQTIGGVFYHIIDEETLANIKTELKRHLELE